MVRRHGRARRLPTVVVCTSLIVLILITFLTDFPKRSVTAHLDTVKEFVFSKQTYPVKEDVHFQTAAYRDIDSKRHPGHLDTTEGAATTTAAQQTTSSTTTKQTTRPVTTLTTAAQPETTTTTKQTTRPVTTTTTAAAQPETTTTTATQPETTTTTATQPETTTTTIAAPLPTTTAKTATTIATTTKPDTDPSEHVVQRITGSNGTVKTTDNEESVSKPRTRLLDENKMMEIEKRFQTRRDHIHEQCKNITQRQIQQCEADDVTSSLKHVEDSNLVYCAIEKTGSTFWRRIVHLAVGSSNESSPFAVAPADVYSKNNSFQELTNATFEELTDIFEASESIMFVRDPLSRLFSAWLDKFYSTNPYFWEKYGRKIIRYERKVASNASRTCGHDVTFPEFVNFISKRIKKNICLDKHFSPNSKHCMPCYFTYDYIGKYETLKEDTYYLLEKLNLSEVVKFTDFEKDAINDVIDNDAKWVFRKRNETKDCVPFRCGLFRVWKRLQSRGVLSKHLELPYKTNKEADNITVEEFTKAISDAHNKSDPEEIAHNRNEVMIEAFGLLPDAVRKRMLDSLGEDIDLFGYDRNPSFLHGKASQQEVINYISECPFTFEDP